MRGLFALVCVAGCGFRPSPVTSSDDDAAGAEGCIPTAEKCNGVDDDCDGMIDEDFPTLGTACDGADLDLCMDGHVVCTADGAGTTCNDDPASIAEGCSNGIDDDCNGYTDCADAPCCADGACATSPFCCTGNGLVHTIDNTCLVDYGSSGSSDNLEVYCCGGITRFCLSKETCPWRGGCSNTTTSDTCSRSGLAGEMMATASCQLWQSVTKYNCSLAAHEYFPP